MNTSRAGAPLFAALGPIIQLSRPVPAASVLFAVSQTSSLQARLLLRIEFLAYSFLPQFVWKMVRRSWDVVQ